MLESKESLLPLSVMLSNRYNAALIPPLTPTHCRIFIMKRSIFVLAGLVFLAMPLQAAELKGNTKAGKTLAYTCTGCHGIAEYKNAYPSYRVPKIAGQNEKYLVASLRGYKKGERNHPTMKAQASSFSEQDIADIAAYLATLKSKP
jgi:cytochrome c553